MKLQSGKAKCRSASGPEQKSSNSVAPRCWRRIVAGLTAALISMSGLSAASAQTLSRADATRLLEQSTFGPTDALVAHVQSAGVNGWLAEQFAAPVSQYPAFPYVPQSGATYCATSTNPNCLRDNYSLFLLQNAFFQNALGGQDQLRQRVAFALSQVFVTSGVTIPQVYGMAAYQQLLLDDAFDNFAQILVDVTLSPVMGAYLNMANNNKPAAGVNPNENYARELMQLFSIGLWELNPNGTQLLDKSGAPMPTYSQDTIEGYAHVFTGWTYEPLTGTVSHTNNPKNYLGTMIGVQTNHDTTAKVLLNGAVDKSGKAISDDLAFALNTIFMHPNVGPFIGRQLIQKLVTANPSAAYVARVAAAFDNNGAGVRGDMKAVIAAVLTDPEARGGTKSSANYGKLREPVLFVTAAARALGTKSDGVFFGPQVKALGQDLFNSPTVFNYYPPDYVVPGTKVLGPEFALQNASTAVNRYNFANALAYGTIGPIASLPGATGTQPDWTPLQALAGDPSALVAELDTLLLHGAMPSALQSTLLTAIAAVPASDPLNRAKMGFYLTVTSPQFQVER
jgi:uncharacterized protein (DUF1800 family)